MEPKSRRCSAVLLPDPEAMSVGCEGAAADVGRRSGINGGGDTELTRTISGDSILNVDDSKGFSHLIANAKPWQSAEWTNEKHNRYLNFLEASFVQKLHNSRSYGGSSEENAPYQPHLVNTRNYCYDERDEPFLDSTANSHVVLKSARQQHFTAAGKCCTRIFSHPPEDQSPCSEGIRLEDSRSAGNFNLHSDCHLSYHNLVGCTAEVSDQNFADEEQGEISSTSALNKRLKTVATDGSSSDQVVPIGKDR